VVGLRGAKRERWPSSEPDHHCYFCSTRTHSSLPSFPSTISSISSMASPTLLIVPPTPRADATTHPQTRPPQPLGQSTHIGRQAKRLQRPSSVFTATTAIVSARQRLRVSSATTPIASLHHLITDTCQLQMGIHHCPITNVSREWYSSRVAGECFCGRVHRDYAPYTTPYSIVAQRNTCRVCKHTGPTVPVAGQLQARPPTTERPFQVYITQQTIQLKRRRPNNNTVHNSF
jgi:hypothetical protein